MGGDFALAIEHPTLLDERPEDLHAPFATFKANVIAIIAKCRTIGAVPVLATIPPNDGGSRHATINTWNAWLKAYGATIGATVLDFYGLLVDPATGNFGTLDSGDGTHPSRAGYLAMGTLAATVLGAKVPNVVPYMSSDNADAINLISTTNSVLITDSDADGVADGWFAYGGSSGFAHALVTDSAVAGKLMQVTQTANTDPRIMTKDTPALTPGHVVAFSGVVTSDGGVKAQVKVTWNGPNSSYRPATFTAAITRGVYYAEFVVPAGTTSGTVDLIADPATGVVAFGQPTVIDLTALGIA